MCRISDAVRLRAGCAVIAAAGIFAHVPASAQEDLTLPPRITEEAPNSPPPIEVPETREDFAIEEIVVISDQNPWRLPDLGSAWRARQEDLQQDTGRISVDLAPLWDPDAEELPTRNPFDVTDGIRRVGFLEIFRVRFGRR